MWDLVIGRRVGLIVPVALLATIRREEADRLVAAELIMIALETVKSGVAVTYEQASQNLMFCE